LKYRPKGNRTPTVEEGRLCAQHWLDEELALVKPQVIVALGSVAPKYLMGPEGRITRDRGRWFETKYGVPAIATYHPAYLLRLTGQDIVKAKWEVFYDLKAAVEKCKELAPDWELASAAKPDLLAMYEGRRQERKRGR
jgi:DNA polymerase